MCLRKLKELLGLKNRRKSRIPGEFPEKYSQINGIGPKTVKDIARDCDSERELIKKLKSDKLPLRDDVVRKLKDELL